MVDFYAKVKEIIQENAFRISGIVQKNGANWQNKPTLFTALIQQPAKPFDFFEKKFSAFLESSQKCGKPEKENSFCLSGKNCRAVLFFSGREQPLAGCITSACLQILAGNTHNHCAVNGSQNIILYPLISVKPQ